MTPIHVRIAGLLEVLALRLDETLAALVVVDDAEGQTEAARVYLLARRIELARTAAELGAKIEAATAVLERVADDDELPPAIADLLG